MAELVTIEDAADPICACSHARKIHGGGGCYGNTSGLYCTCSMSFTEVDRAHIEGIVRREVAKELERLGDTTMRLYRNTLRERAEEIRNG